MLGEGTSSDNDIHVEEGASDLKVNLERFGQPANYSNTPSQWLPPCIPVRKKYHSFCWCLS